ncbi:invasion protein [Clostridia bacterium]|nr:invasion protein [Clostridia bacterium]
MTRESFIQDTETVRVLDRFDIIVAGGGVAGCAAALAARRHGKRVLLLEKSLTLGGLATLGLINYFEPLCNGRGRQIMKGMPEEFLRIAVRYGYDTIPDVWKQGEPCSRGESTDVRYISHYSPQLFALALMEQMTREGVTIQLDCLAVKPVMNGAVVKGIIVETKSGRGYYETRMVIDVTGDADLLKRAGVPVVDGQNYFTYISHAITLDSCRRAVELGRIDKAVYWRNGGEATLYGERQPADRKLYSGISADDVTEYIIENQLELLSKLRDEDRFTRDIVTLPGMPQFRTTRRIDGDYTLSTDDADKHFDDSIGAICDFDNPDTLYEVPYRCLICSGFPNIITAGRSVSAKGYAWDVARVIPPAIATGQAAGVAASLAVESAHDVTRVDVEHLHTVLESDGVSVHF